MYPFAALCDENLMPAMVASMTSSSEYGSGDKTTNYGAARGVINSTEVKDASGVTQMGAWVAEKSNFNQWIQVL